MNQIFNRVVHFEIHAGDPERAIKFYTEVFGWSIKKWEGTDVEYWLVATSPEKTPSAINGGLTRRRGEAPANDAAINGYVCMINVEDVDSILKKVQKAGGTVALAKFEVPGIGFLAYFKDTEGNTFGTWQDVRKRI